MRKYLILTLIIFCTAYSGAQSVHSPYSLDALVEELIEYSDEGFTDIEWIESLQSLHENPIDLNQATIEQLGSIPFLDPIVAGNILKYRLDAGEFLSVFELSSVEGVSPDMAKKLALFVFVMGENSIPISKSRNRTQQQLLIKGWQTFPLSSGYLPKAGKAPAYLGDPRKYYARYSVSRNNSFEAGITADKDPGEPFFSGANQEGFDFYSAHLSLQLKPGQPYVILGDYSVKSGQGLILQPGFSLGKTANVLHSGNPGMRLRPYTSTNENYFFRGVATRIRIQSVDAVLFTSYKKSDGNRIFHEDGSISISGLQTSGYHRTKSEMDDKNRVGHTVHGAVFSKLLGRTRWGVTLLYERFQYPIANSSQLYQKFQFQGRSNANFGIDYRHIRGKYQLFGEGAVCKDGGVAIVQGLIANLHDQVTLSMLYRNYGYRYHSTWGNGFGETNHVNNESGFYAGFRLLPFAGISLSAYSDWFSSDWMSSSTVGPSRGKDLMIQCDIRISRKLDGYIRFKNKAKSKKSEMGTAFFDEENQRTGTRFHLNITPLTNWIFRTRAELCLIQNGNTEKGLMVFQDIGWNASKPELSLFARIAYFTTDSYDSRIYAYENDLLYNFSTLSFFGEGFRSYLNLRYRFSNHLDIWLKLARTAYFNQDNIGSGYNLIEGNSKSEMKIQLRYQL